ncbi:hypothetical protein AB9K41_00710, partial [Cribrihabitans sp. XS_ASV171]
QQNRAGKHKRHVLDGGLNPDQDCGHADIACLRARCSGGGRKNGRQTDWRPKESLKRRLHSHG